MSGLLRQKLGEATEFEGLRGLRKRMQERYLEEKRDTEQAKPLLPKKAATEKPLPKEKPAPEPIGAAPQLKTVRKRVELDERNISDLKQQRKPSIKRNKLRELTQVSSNLSKQVKEVHSKAMYSKLLEFKQLKQHVRPASVFCSVPLSVLLLLWLGAGSASHPQNGFGMALGAIYSQPLQAAPKAVQVEEVEAKAVSLDDGSSVILVTGSINNRSKETLRNIQLSVSLYDQNNELISRKTILHEHALLGAHRIESLSAQMIDDLQSRPRATLKPLKPETKAAFKAIFTSVDNEIRWASARIHGTHFLN